MLIFLWIIASLFINYWIWNNYQMTIWRHNLTNFGKDPFEMEHKIGQMLDQLSIFFEAKRLSLNSNETKLILFSPRKNWMVLVSKSMENTIYGMYQTKVSSKVFRIDIEWKLKF